MRIPQSFFYNALKPGRYIGADVDASHRPETGTRRVVWCYPGRYEDAVTDPGYRRGFFTLRSIPGIHAMRAVDFARDAWALLGERGLPPFTLDGHEPIADAELIVVWAPNVFVAAGIPSLLAKLHVEKARTTIGVVINGCWAPPFLNGHVDWICAAPHGWLPASIDRLVTGGDVDDPGVFIEGTHPWESISQWTPDSIPLRSAEPAPAGAWLPVVETGCPFGDVDLLTVGRDDRLTLRTVSNCVEEAIDALRTTGLDGLRFVDSEIDTGTCIPIILLELARRHKMAHLQIDLPPVHIAEFTQHWRAYKPHLIKPVLRLKIGAGDDAELAIDAGRDALNDGWHGLTLVPVFDSFAEFSDLVPVIERVTQAWSRVAAGFEDRRPMRVHYRPAPIESWTDPPSNPTEQDLRRLLHECRHLSESLGSSISVGPLRIEHVIARNWLAATADDLWERLAALDLSESTEVQLPPFDWLGWIRNRAGLTGPPDAPFSRGRITKKTEIPFSESVAISTGSQASGTGPADTNMYGRRRRRAPVSRRLQSPARNRLRICWGKSVDWRFFSHLDMVRVVERAIRIAGIPVSYSEGFHPRMKLSFGPPLSFGLISRAELFDVILERDAEDGDVEAIRQAFPAGVELVRGEGLPSHVPSLTESINEAEYRALLSLDPESAQSLIEVFFNQPSIMFTRRDRPDRKPFDPRVSLRATEMEVIPDGVCWTIKLSLGTQGQIRPTEWAKLIFGFNDDQLGDLVIERTALRVRQNDAVRSAFDLMKV